MLNCFIHLLLGKLRPRTWVPLLPQTGDKTSLYVRSTARHAIHLRLHLTLALKALEIRAIQSPKCIVCC
jgi:hypothetical protein